LFVSVYFLSRKRSRKDDENVKKIKELEKCLKESLEKCAAERQGRIRAQQVTFSFLNA
jgi:hypothetical protein